MKKNLALLFGLVLVMSLFTACSSGGGKAKTGLAVVTSTDHSSKDAGEEDGLAQADSTVAAVIVDSKGVITNVKFDVLQTKTKFNAAGELTTDAAATFDSKEMLGEAYGMRKASPIGKEWFEQADALAEYVTGKTLKEVQGIALDGGYPTASDLTSSVTMNISDMISAVEKAVNNAQDLGASADDKLGLGLVGNLHKSTKNASAEGDGAATAYNHYAAVTFNKDSKITSSIIDASQATVNFSVEGKITTDLANEVYETKLELGDRYDMKKASGIGKEWFEQSKGFSDYIAGKTVAEVTGIAVDGGYPSAADLTSSVTMSITDMQTAVERAGANAK
ncbi:MAG TPA: hypothetical protein GX731_02715 [Clostridiales bacterium]|nr:hypothetical protein [Clostridiales bacterium]